MRTLLLVMMAMLLPSMAWADGAADAARPENESEDLMTDNGTGICFYLNGEGNAVLTYKDAYESCGYSFDGDVLELPSKVSQDGVEYTVVAVGPSAFYAAGITGELIIPTSIMTLGSACFGENTALETVTFVESETPIEDTNDNDKTKMFSGCSGLRTVNMWRELMIVEDSDNNGPPFKQRDIETLNVGKYVTRIYARCFYECKNLETVNIEEGSMLETIGRMAFRQCESLTNLTIPEHVYYIDYWTFYRNYALEGTVLTVKNPEPPECDSQAFQGTAIGDITLCVPGGSRELYEEADVWKNFGNVTEFFEGDAAGINALLSAIEVAQRYVDDYGTEYFYNKVKMEELAAEIAAAQAIYTEGDNDACQEEADKLTEMTNSVMEDEIGAYKDLQSFLDQIMEDANKYVEIEELFGELIDMYEEYYNAYEDGSATKEGIAEWMDGYDSVIMSHIRDVMKYATEDDPVDITVLGVNMDYANNDLEGWELTYGNILPSRNYESGYNVCSVYGNPFVCLQTIGGMPAGKYRLTAQAMYKQDKYQANYNAWISGDGYVLTYLVVEKGKALVHNQAEGAIEVDSKPSGYDSPASGIYVPNSLQGAHYAFTNYPDQFFSEVEGYLFNDGDLTFGIRNDEETGVDAWSLWSDFHLYYYGESSSAMYYTMLELVEEAETLQSQLNGLVTQADEWLSEAIIAASDLTEDSDADELTAAVEALQEAIDYANESVSKVYEVMDMLEIYDVKMQKDVESTDTEFPTLYAEIENAIGKEEIESIDKMEEWLAQLPVAWTAYVQHDCLETATEEEPADITEAVINPSFDEGTNNKSGATGWSFECAGDHIGYNSEEQQINSGNAFEFWKMTTFSMSQTISGLAAGYYRLGVNALYRAGDNTDAVAASYYADPDEARDVSLFANGREVAVCAVYDFAQTDATGAGGEATYTYDGTTYYVPNTMQSAGAYFALGYYPNELEISLNEGEDLTIGLMLDGNVVSNNWCVWDDFTLLYLGTEAPVKVESVETEGGAVAGIYDLAGRKIARMQRGVNIVKTQQANGTISTRKVIVR